MSSEPSPAEDNETCAYVARKDNPSNWHGDEWIIDEEAPLGLEQDIWECPHEALDGEEYCAFHTHPDDVPDDVDEGELFVEAVNEASAVKDDETARRKKEFIGATFGAFDIEGAVLDAGDDHPIRFDHAEFRRGVTSKEPVFEHPVRASCALFETRDRETSNGIGKVLFGKAEFRGDGDISFENAEFRGDGKVSFFKSTFSGDGDISFENAEFRGDGKVLFFKSTFSGDGDISFENAEFSRDGDVSFSMVGFNGDGGVSFSSAKFSGDGEASFIRAKFGGDGRVSFENADFSGDGGVSFSSAKFSDASEVLFFQAEFSGNGEVSFKQVEFTEASFFGAEFSGNGDVSFENAEFTETSFQMAEFSRDGDVSFENAEFSGDDEVSVSFTLFTGTSFQMAEFSRDGDVSFENAEFRGDGRVLFFQAEFSGNGEVSFKQVEFSCPVIFGNKSDSVPYIQRPLDFTDAVFHDKLDLCDVSVEEQIDNHKMEMKKEFRFVFAEPVDFTRVEFPDRTDFSDIRFASESKFTDIVARNADFSGTDFTGTDEVSQASFDGADLSGADFSDANLRGASLERARLNRAELLGTKLAGAKLYGALLGDARVNRGTEFWLPSDAEHRGSDDSAFPLRAVRRVKNALRRGPEPYCAYDPRYRGEDGEADLEKAAEVYGTLETVATDNSLPGLASDCFLGRKDVQLKEYRKDGDRRMIARSIVPNTVARYGESPFRVLGTGAFIVLICGLAYHAFNLIEKTSADGPSTLFDALYFSALTFTTLGYGDFNPTTQAGQVLAVAETSAGVILLAILVFVFGRRATR